MNSGADSFSFSCSPAPPSETPIYRKIMRENLWWEKSSLDDMLLRMSLIKVEGFSTPEENSKNLLMT